VLLLLLVIISSAYRLSPARVMQSAQAADLIFENGADKILAYIGGSNEHFALLPANYEAVL
jgi:hypothetical protein